VGLSDASRRPRNPAALISNPRGRPFLLETRRVVAWLTLFARDRAIVASFVEEVETDSACPRCILEGAVTVPKFSNNSDAFVAFAMGR
jgi:hypothetical protein